MAAAGPNYGAQVALIAHLSDLHLGNHPEDQCAIFDGLVLALEAERRFRGRAFDLLVITGDVFDSATADPQAAAAAFGALHQRILQALGEDAATVIVPGNHDRRRIGFFGPHREGLFKTLGEVMGGRAWVHGCHTTPFLAEALPHAFHNLPMSLLAYDSSYLPRGVMGAGGWVRQEDLLYAASQMAGDDPEWPVVFLLHHHLVPTPITDLHPVRVAFNNPLLERAVRWGLERALPQLIAHADKEELTMTALGAGTAISTLHTLNRPVLVFHGHKHYATARTLKGTWRGQGDVLIVSAGSAGTAQEWTPDGSRDAARLWPSFNVVELGDTIEVDTVAFGWKGRSYGQPERRPLVRARRCGAQWIPTPIDSSKRLARNERLELNRAHYQVSPSSNWGPERWDYRCEREIRVTRGERLGRYGETIQTEKGARVNVHPDSDSTHEWRELPHELELKLDGTTQFWVDGALHRTLAARRAAEGAQAAPFAWLGLMNRYGSQLAMLSISGLQAWAQLAFASAVELSTGLERPLAVDREDGRVSVRLQHCPPRTLLRIYWPLFRSVSERCVTPGPLPPSTAPSGRVGGRPTQSTVLDGGRGLSVQVSTPNPP